ncbi:ankyrin repeat domain-containing protein [Limnohabitans sp. Hippo3]|uniref:ankyrin repeat domain-containing protein n=1 Tax=Limnohabitans sp. Hippo3 TaxID=1597956 RepID=UPI001E61AD80|nr:ankyrin repeat domain-containing protein [Limnohabitans sp. Hippo3]
MSITWAGSYEDFFKAIQFDDVKTVQSLLQRGFDPNTVNPSGVSGLMLAVREPSLKVAELLAGWPKVKVEVRNDKDESALMLAALKGYLPLVKKLVENDADVNKPGWTPLHYAASAGQVQVIEFLLEQSAYIDAESPNGTTPLMMAAMYGSPEAVKVLIQAGADLNIKNQLGMTALDFAVRGQRKNAKELIEVGLQRQRARAARLEDPAVPTRALEPATNAAVTQPGSLSAVVQTSPPIGPAQVDSAAKVPSKPFKTGW